MFALVVDVVVAFVVVDDDIVVVIVGGWWWCCCDNCYCIVVAIVVVVVIVAIVVAVVIVVIAVVIVNVAVIVLLRICGFGCSSNVCNYLLLRSGMAVVVLDVVFGCSYWLLCLFLASQTPNVSNSIIFIFFFLSSELRPNPGAVLLPSRVRPRLQRAACSSRARPARSGCGGRRRQRRRRKRRGGGRRGTTCLLSCGRAKTRVKHLWEF